MQLHHLLGLGFDKHIYCHFQQIMSSVYQCSSSYCRPYALKYAEDQDLFFKEYAEAHLKLSELGMQFFAWVFNQLPPPSRLIAAVKSGGFSLTAEADSPLGL